MSLVAYDNSSGSESEDDVHETSPTLTVTSTVKDSDVKNTKPLSKVTITSSKEAPADIANEAASKSVSFSNLPQPTKNKKIIQFSIPLPSDFDSDEENEEQNKKPRVEISKSGSGLITLLPQPKERPISTTSFIPNSLKKKNDKETVTSTTSFVPNVLRKLKEDNEIAGSDDEDDDIVIPETFDEETWQKVCGRPVQAPTKRKILDTTPKVNSESYFVDSAPPASKPYTGLDNEAFKELVGSNKRRKKTEIEIVDINEDDIRADKEQWLKSLTDPNLEAPTQIKNPVDGTRKAKNHITALAQKAVANDKDLQIQWSENKFKRGQTRAKYGF